MHRRGHGHSFRRRRELRSSMDAGTGHWARHGPCHWDCAKGPAALPVTDQAGCDTTLNFEDLQEPADRAGPHGLSGNLRRHMHG